MENKDVNTQFTPLDFEYKIEAAEKTEHTNKRTRNGSGSSENLRLDGIRTVKVKQESIKINSVITCKEVEDSKKPEVIALQLYKPKVSHNSLIGAVAYKGYAAQRAEEKRTRQTKLNNYPYSKKAKLLTENGNNLYFYLIKNLPNTISIFVKIRLSDIVDVSDKALGIEEYSHQIYNECIDFLICSRQDLSVICAVELEDISSNKVTRKEKQQFTEGVLKECGVKLLRTKFTFNIIEEITLREIERLILENQAPECPICNSKMSINTSKNQKNYGHRFYGCTKYPKCKGTIDID